MICRDDDIDSIEAVLVELGYERAAALRDFFAPGDGKVVYVRRLIETA